MRYKTGDEIYDISRDRIGVVLSVGDDTYELALDGYDLPLFASENSLILLDDIGRLQAENERLKAALGKVVELFTAAQEVYFETVPEASDYESGQVDAYRRVLALFSEGEQSS